MPGSSTKPRPKRRSRAAGFGQKGRRSCCFCNDQLEEVDFRNVVALRRTTSDKGKIRSRRVMGTCRRHQNQVGAAIRRAREMALLPYVNS